MNQRPKSRKKQRQRITSEANVLVKDVPASPIIAADEPWFREFFESIVVAILLALLFRGFEAEAFIIPTGSMAPTLQGRHKDVRCPQCGKLYQAGAAQNPSPYGPIVGTSCPMCGFEATIDPDNRNHDSFSGDRILVNKFIYQNSEPKRWDVIVFKFPGNAKQNYIKRLVGLPNETLHIQSGDIYAKSPTSANEILRKPPEKIRAVLHTVHDTRYIPEPLIAAGWPARWHDVSGRWKTSTDQTEYTLQAGDGKTSWLRYRHLPADRFDWNDILQGRLPRDINQRQGELISDWYAYNAYRYLHDTRSEISRRNSGWHWVGDLAVEALVEIESGAGELVLQLVEGGHKLDCRIDVATGTATITIDDGELAFASTDGTAAPTTLTAATPIRSPATYRVMWANIDNQVILWVNDRLIQLTAGEEDHTGQFVFPADLKPSWSPDDSGDLKPLGIGGQDLSVAVRDLRVYRDSYYVAAKANGMMEYLPDSEFSGRDGYDRVQRVFRSPEVWNSTTLFDTRRSDLEFELGPDQFFPMGDNSPQSKDARLWGGEQDSRWDKQDGVEDGRIDVVPYVDRRLLIGKAFFVYWPHGWNPGNIRLPILPNLDRMGRIR